MAPIRKGDGTPLEIPGVSEVRSGDGRVFFEGDAIPDSVVLQPEPNDLDNFSGDTNLFTIEDVNNFGDGDFILRGEYDDTEPSDIFSDSGLNAYPEVEQRLSAKVRLSDEESFIYVGFGAQDIDNHYGVSLSADDRFEIRKDFGESQTSTPTVNIDTVYVISWVWSSDTPNIEAELYEGEDSDVMNDTPLATVTFDDTDYTQGGVLIRNWRNTSDGEPQPESSLADYYIEESL